MAQKIMESYKNVFLICIVGLGFISGPAYAEQFGIEWTAPTQACDGSTLSGGISVGTYTVYFSKGSGRPNPATQACEEENRFDYEYEVVVDANQTSVFIEVEPGNYYATVTASNQWIGESNYSEERLYVVTDSGIDESVPEEPTGFEISFR